MRLEQQLHDLMARMTELKRQARYFSLPEEYQPNPHFVDLLNLSLQALGGTGGGGGGGDTPAPGQGGEAAGTAGGASAEPEGGPEDMQQD